MVETTSRVLDVLDVLAENADDPGPWAVYSDLLQTEADPRGELINLMIERERQPSRRLLDLQRRYFEKHGDALASAAGVKVCAWRRGFPSEVRLDAHDQLAEVAADPTLRFLEDATIAMEGARWAEWQVALAARPVPWRRVRVEITDLEEPLAVAAWTRCFAQVETLRIAFPADAPGTLSWQDVRAPRLRLLTLVNAGELTALGAADAPMLEELRLLGTTTAGEALRACRQLQRVVLSSGRDGLDGVDAPPIIRRVPPVSEELDTGPVRAFMVIGGALDRALMKRLVARMAGVTQLSARIAELWWLPRMLTVVELYGGAGATMLPYTLAVSLEQMLAPPPPIALFEVDDYRGRYLVLGKSPARGTEDVPREPVRRALDLALGRDPGTAIMQDLVDALDAAEVTTLCGDPRSHRLLTAIDLAAPTLAEIQEEEQAYDEDRDEDEYDPYEDFDDEAAAAYEEPLELADDDASVDDEPEPDEAINERPEQWLDFREHWDDRAIDPNDEAGEIRWPDPGREVDIVERFLERQPSDTECRRHGSAHEECRWCGVLHCVECTTHDGAHGVEGTCASCTAELEVPLAVVVAARARARMRVIS